MLHRFIFTIFGVPGSIRDENFEKLIADLIEF